MRPSDRKDFCCLACLSDRNREKNGMKTVSLKLRMILTALAVMLVSGCAPAQNPVPSASPSSQPVSKTAEPSQPFSAEPEAETEEKKSDDIIILFTSDMHCGMDQGFGAEGLAQIRNTLRKKGVTTLLVDDGDAIQGEVVGTLSKGKDIIELMNALKYDAAIPGNHEFDFGADYFLELTKDAEYPYICCNLFKDGERVFPAYIIREANGKKIAFVGVTTPRTITSCNPRNFMDEEGNTVYDFCFDTTGEKLLEEIQKSVDEAKREGADYVFLLSHIGKDETLAPYNFQTIIENTSGIDVILDGHTHDTDQVTMNDREGNPVIRSACGTKLQAVGYVKIDGEDGKLSSGLYTWNNEQSLDELIDINNELSAPLEETYEQLEEVMEVVVAKSDVDLTISDPEKKDSAGKPVRIIRGKETNLGDLVADAVRIETDTDIALINAGGIRDSIPAGDITYGDIIAVMPFNNQICVSELTGQQIIDALEWGCAKLPADTGAFLQVSGLSYEVHLYLPSTYTIDTSGLSAEVSGEYRVKNVRVSGEPIDPKKTYTVSGLDFVLKNHGSGFGMMGPEDVIIDEIGLDNQMLIDYINEELDGSVDEAYSNPYGEGRIIIYEEKPE